MFTIKQIILWMFISQIVSTVAAEKPENISKGSSYFSECFWSPCFSKQSVTSDEMACGSGSVVAETRIKQECHTDDFVPGFQYSCCIKEKWSLSEIKHIAGNGTINCTLTPIEQYIGDFVIQFFLYTKNNSNPFDFKEVRLNDVESLKKSGFIKNAPLKLIIHGFLSNTITGPVRTLREYYLRRNTTINIIAVDWPVADIPCHNIAVQFTKAVGKRSALFLYFILEQNVVALKDIHVIGHSLGAHISGFTGKRFFEFTGKRLPRLTGLDPTLTGFENKRPEDRIDRSDADFVDIIHTSIFDRALYPGFLVPMIIGNEQPVGHADFYPNKGGRQPGCKNLGTLSSLCSHFRSIDYYAESIHPPSNKVFRGKLCKNLDRAKRGDCRAMETSLMGENTDLNNSTSLIYYLETNEKSPFALDERKPSDLLFRYIT